MLGFGQFVSAVIFLTGMIMVVAGIFPIVNERYPKIMVQGMMVAASSLVLMLFFALLFG